MSTQVMLTGEQMQDLLSDNLAEDYVLSSIYEVENVLLMLKSMKEKVEFLKGLKKHRAKSIDEKICDLDCRSTRLRGVILHTMKSLNPDNNSLSFPSIGAVTRKKAVGKWNVDNEENLMNFLDQNGCKDDVIKTKQTVDSRQLKKILDDFASARVDVPGVTHIKGTESISIKYEDKKVSKVADNKSLVMQQTSDVLDSLDTLTVEDV